MQKFIHTTADGSHTIEIPEMGVTYHSKHGAIAESMHVYIEAGLNNSIPEKNAEPFRILEMGFGTGLNALLTLQVADTKSIGIDYTALELFPLNAADFSVLNYGEILALQASYLQLHQTAWNEKVMISPNFTLTKIHASLSDFTSDARFHCIYFDAFSPTVQPELWTREVFEKMFLLLQPNGTLVTYCSKTIVRKAMQEAGFRVEKIPGPRGKREMVRAKKIL